MTSQIPIETLVRLEAGLRAELSVLQASSDRDILEDAKDELEFSISDAQLEGLLRAKQVLEEELRLSTRRLKRRLQIVRDFNLNHSESFGNVEEEDESEEGLRKELYALRRRTLAFAKEQWPLTQDAEEFEGGDFWDACVAACARKGTTIEYSGKEVGFAELLLQAGVADRLEDIAGMKRIKLADELYLFSED